MWVCEGGRTLCNGVTKAIRDSVLRGREGHCGCYEKSRRVREKNVPAEDAGETIEMPPQPWSSCPQTLDS